MICRLNAISAPSTVPVIAFSLLLLWLQLYTAAILVLCILSGVCLYYNMVYLYSRCARVMGGAGKNRIHYFLGATFTTIGLSLVAESFILGYRHQRIGIIFLLTGMGLSIFATKHLFDQIVRKGIK